MSNARQRILQRLAAHRPSLPAVSEIPAVDANWTLEQRIERFISRQSAVHGEVHRMKKEPWVDWLSSNLSARGLRRVLVGTGEIGNNPALSQITGIELRRYEERIESWKEDLFNSIDVAITGCRGGIADTGSLILWPDSDEPRLLSLVPPVHIVLLHVEALYQTFAEVMQKEQWATQMPTNALLISGPSKTADIEQTLAYGIHGPRELITLLLE